MDQLRTSPESEDERKTYRYRLRSKIIIFIWISIKQDHYEAKTLYTTVSARTKPNRQNIFAKSADELQRRDGKNDAEV